MSERFIIPDINKRYNEIWNSQPHTLDECAGMNFMNEFAQKSPVMGFADHRLGYMDQGNIDVQVLGYGNSSPMTLNATDVVPLLFRRGTLGRRGSDAIGGRRRAADKNEKTEMMNDACS